jgi:hypothetical protein
MRSAPLTRWTALDLNEVTQKQVSRWAFGIAITLSTIALVGELAIGDTDRIWVPIGVLVLTIGGLSVGAGWRATRHRLRAKRHRGDA